APGRGQPALPPSAPKVLRSDWSVVGSPRPACDSRPFCPMCGSPAYSLNSGTPELFFVRAASLDDPSRFVAQMVVYTSNGFTWDYLDPALPKFDKMPPMAPQR